MTGSGDGGKDDNPEVNLRIMGARLLTAGQVFRLERN